MAGTDVVSGCTPRNWPSMKAASTPSVMYDPSRLTIAVTLDDAMKSPAPITQPLGSEPPDGSSSPGQCTGDGEGEGEGEGGRTPSLHADERPADEQLRDLWSQLLEGALPTDAKVHWPSLRSIHSEVMSGDYDLLLRRRADWRPTEASPKQLCANGMVALAEIEWAPGATGGAGQPPRWTGMFAGSSTGVGILRLSAACKPPAGRAMRLAISSLGWGDAGGLATAALFPCAAFKFPRRGAPSANLLLMGQKRGQPSPNFFDKAVCTSIKERAVGIVKRSIDSFRRYTDYPTSLGLSDFAAADRDGRRNGARWVGKHTEEPPPRFPWCLVMRPTQRMRAKAQEAVCSGATGCGGSESFLQQLKLYEPGEILYDVYAAATPAAMLEETATDSTCGLLRVGRVVLRSRFIRSAAEGKLVFYHQRREDDYAIRPEWREEHTAHHSQVCDAETFSQLLEARRYVEPCPVSCGIDDL